MVLRELYHPESERMRVIGLMSGSGTNLVKIIEYERRIGSRQTVPYKVVAIFTENPKSNAREIGMKFGIPVIVRDMAKFYEERETSRRDLKVRKEFDTETVEKLKPFNVDVAAYAGYMSIATDPLTEAFLGVNVHPADLSIMDGDQRRYVGAHAVRDAILSGETHLRATTHLIEREVDYGRILMISRPVTIDYGHDISNNQGRLKRLGDWEIFPKTLEYIANGRYSQDKQGRLYFDDKPIPFGLKLEAT